MSRIANRARVKSHMSAIQPAETADGRQSSFLHLIKEEVARAGVTDAWQVTPPSPASPVWIHLRRPAQETPPQGWKLHISATILSAEQVLRCTLSVLLDDTAPFKVAASPETLSLLNEGGGELSQTGKFITVYPADDAHAVRLATALDAVTDGLAGPAILSDRPLRPGSLVHYRYGGFARMLLQQATGRVLSAVRSPDGALVPDQRLPFYSRAPWARDPFIEAGVATRPEPNLTIGGRYAVLSTLAQSPSGTVYLALDLTARRRCVLKRARRHAVTLRDGRDARDRLRHEAVVLAVLAPAGCAPEPFDLIEQDGDLYLAMEDIDGETLERRVRSLATAGRPIPPEQIVAWGRDLAATLGSVHTHGYVYRDLKSTNVIITADSSLRLIDFEFAHALDGGTQPFGRGTRGYLSPQQNAGDPPAVTDDVFSLGAVLYLLATGAEPSLAPGEPVLTDRPLPLMNPLLGSGLVRVIERCLDPDPARRFPSMQALDAALTALNSASDLLPPPTGTQIAGAYRPSSLPCAGASLG